MASENTRRVSAEELRNFIHRFEYFEAEKKEISESQSELMKAARAAGYDTNAIRKIIAMRKREPDDIAEEEAVVDLYKEALGMAP